MANTTPPAETPTLKEFIKAGVNDDMTYRNFAILEVIPCGLELVDHSLIDDYLTELRTVSTTINQISDAERTKYRYCPDMLAYDIYGSTQLDFIVMMVNGVVTPTEFTMRGDLLLPKASVLKEFLSMVYNADNEYIRINRSTNNIT